MSGRVSPSLPQSLLLAAEAVALVSIAEAPGAPGTDVKSEVLGDPEFSTKE